MGFDRYCRGSAGAWRPLFNSGSRQGHRFVNGSGATERVQFQKMTIINRITKENGMLNRTQWERVAIRTGSSTNRVHQHSLLKVSASVATMLSMLSSGTSMAADVDDNTKLDAVVVTAQKRNQYLKDVPASVTALGGKQLEASGVSNLRDYAVMIPGLIYSGTPRNGERSGPDVTIRGISNSRLFDFETSIATSTTGFVYGEMPVYSFDPQVMDIERIEVLKGPQGTLYGSSSMGGTVKLVPYKPNASKLIAKVSGSYSLTNDGGPNHEFAGMVNVPLADEVLALRVSTYKKEESGFIDAKMVKGLPNEIRGRDAIVSGLNPNDQHVFGQEGSTRSNVNGTHVTGGRAAIRYTPNDKFDATLAYFYQKTDQDSTSNFEPTLATALNKRVSELYRLQPSATDYSIGSLEASYDFGPATLTSVSGWLNRKFSNITDFTPQTYAALGGNGLVPAPDLAPVTFVVDTNIVSQELRLQGVEKNLVGANSALDWTVGYFYQEEKRKSFGGVTVGSLWMANAALPLKPPPSGTQTVWDADYTSTYLNNSFFGDASLRIDAFTVSLGMRYSDQSLVSSRLDFGNVFSGASTPTGTTLDERTIGEKRWTPKGSLSYKATNDVTLYTAAAQGFRIGGGNPAGNLSTVSCQAALAALGMTANANFKSDSVWNYEAGVRSNWYGGRINGNISAYQVDWDDMQVSVSLSAFNPGCGQSLVSNVGRGRIKGVEYSLQAMLTDALSLDASGQLAKAELVEAAPGTPAKNGDPLKNIPTATYSIGLNQKLTLSNGLRGTFRLDYAYQGERSLNFVGTAVNPDLNLPGYGIVNARFSIAKDDWSAEIFGDNLTDTVAQLGVQIVPGGPGVYSGAYAPGRQRFVTTNRPRTIGIKLTKSF